MDYVALYRKWRPMTFDEVVEQDNIVTILKNTVKSRRIAHAYLFCGTRGTGKTSLAKIFARAINCLSPRDGNPCNECEICRGLLSDTLLDVSEIDAASNNSVDNVRAIIEESAYSATKAEYRVFIIDEVHMLTNYAYNALLKTLEEPPEKVVFILATTEPHALPVTILSRCQRYDFRRISRAGIVARLEEICQSLGVRYEEAALNFIAQKADGALRDAISLLDQTLSSAEGNLTLQAARASSGSLDRETIELFTEKLLLRDGSALLTLTDRIFADGRDISNFICELIDLFRSMMIVLSVRSPGSLLTESEDGLARLKKLASLTNLKEISMIIKELSTLENTLKWSVQRKTLFEASMLSLCDRTWSGVTELQDRVQYLEQQLADLVANGLKVAAVSTLSGTGTGDGTALPGKKAAPEEDGAAAEQNGGGSGNGGEPAGAGGSAGSREASEELEEFDPDALVAVEEMDWRDFLAAVSDQKKQGLSSGMKVHAKGYLIGNTLHIVFATKRIMDITCRQDCLPLLKECAAVAFGKPLNVVLDTRDHFLALAPQLAAEAQSVAKSAEEKKVFDNALGLLKQLSEEQGFPVGEGEEIPGGAAEGVTFSVKSAARKTGEPEENRFAGEESASPPPDSPDGSFRPSGKTSSGDPEEPPSVYEGAEYGEESAYGAPPPGEDDAPPESDFDFEEFDPDSDQDSF